MMRMRFLLSMILVSFAFRLYAGDPAWDFQYVSSLKMQQEPSRLWFTRDEAGLEPEIVSDSMTPDEGPYALYMHSSTYGAGGMKMDISPLEGRGSSIAYSFSCTGHDDLQMDVEDAPGSFSFGPWEDHELIVMNRTWKLEVTPDERQMSNAMAGVYSMTIQVEVTGA